MFKVETLESEEIPCRGWEMCCFEGEGKKRNRDG